MVIEIIVIIFVISSIIAVIYISSLSKSKKKSVHIYKSPDVISYKSLENHSTTKKQEIILCDNVDRIARETQQKFKMNVSSAILSVNEITDGFIDNLKDDGIQVAKEGISYLDGFLYEELEKTSWWDRIGLDVNKLVKQSVVPIILNVYEKFIKEKKQELGERLEKKVGPLWAELVSPDVSYRNGGNYDEGDSLLKDMAIGFGVGAAGGAAASLLGGPITLAIMGMIALATYKSKDQIRNEVMKTCKPLVIGLFADRGFRNPNDGSSIPSVVVVLKDQANQIREDLNRRIKSEGEKLIFRIETRRLHLRKLCESGQIPLSKLQERTFIEHYLLSEGKSNNTRRLRSGN